MSEKSWQTIDLIDVNRDRVQEFYPEIKAQLAEEKRLNLNERRAKVQAVRLASEAARLKTFEERIKNKDGRAQVKNLVSSSDRAKNARLQTVQHRWFLGVALASRLALVKSFLEEKHRMRMAYMMYNHCALTIQKKWRQYQWKKRQEAIRKSYSIIRTYVPTTSLLPLQRVCEVSQASQRDRKAQFG